MVTPVIVSCISELLERLQKVKRVLQVCLCLFVPLVNWIPWACAPTG